MIKKFVVMELGMSGAEILKAQKLLQKHGSSIKANGVYTIGMVSAVRAFQKKNGLAVTGKIDKITLNKLSVVPSKKIIKMVSKKK